MKPYLSICAAYRYEGPYLREWVAFHRVVGVERFFLYDNDSDDEHLEALAPYLEDGTVVRRHWPQYPWAQSSAWKHLLTEHGDASRWVAFMDVDEFLFSPSGTPLPEVLRRYERWPAVGVNQVLFGPNGHSTKPDGLVVESYTMRLQMSGARPAVKSIVDPARATKPFNSHVFALTEGYPVDEHGEPLVDERFTRTGSSELLRLNHYYTKSDEEFMRKLGRRTVNGSVRKGKAVPGRILRQERRFGVRDESILQYVPALRSELERIA